MDFLKLVHMEFIYYQLFLGLELPLNNIEKSWTKIVSQLFGTISISLMKNSSDLLY